jgi:hypothetical protein
MAIVVREVSDDDLSRAIEVEIAAYADNPLSPLLFPGPFPPDASKDRVPDLIKLRNSDHTVKFIQAYDEETKQLVAFAKWSIYKTDEEAAASDRPMRSFGAGTNREGCEAFFGILKSKKQELMGHKPHLCKFVLSCLFLKSCLYLICFLVICNQFVGLHFASKHATTFRKNRLFTKLRSSHVAYRPCIPRARRWWDVGRVGNQKS